MLWKGDVHWREWDDDGFHGLGWKRPSRLSAFNPLHFSSPGDEQRLEIHFPRFCISPLKVLDVKQLHPTLERSSFALYLPPLFHSTQLSTDLVPCTIPSSGGTNLTAVTESKDKSRLQITPWACDQENASSEESHLPTCPPLGFAGRVLSQLFRTVV